MGINVSTSMGFENKNLLKNTAKNILQNKGMDSAKAENAAQKVIYDFFEEPSTGLTVLKASTQISVNNSLQETLNYLKAHANEKRKKEYVFGELWNTLSTGKDNDIGDIVDFDIDYSDKNIFAA